MRTIRPELLEELLSGYENPTDLLGETGLFRDLKKALLEKALGAELTSHLGYEKGTKRPAGRANSRNGHSAKTVLTEDGALPLAIPRDRHGTFEPVIVPKGVTRLDGFDDKVLSLYARGLTVREIEAHLREIYGIDVSPDLISRVTDAVSAEVKAWQSRPLERCYPVLFLDALRVRIRDGGAVRNKAVYIALALNGDGEKEVLGLWIEQTEGAKFWLSILNELKNRGVEDILIAVVDGLKGFPEAIEAAFPDTVIQTCIVHLIRNSMAQMSWKDRKTVVPALKEVYKAPTAKAAEAALEAFETTWGGRYPQVAPMWRRAWAQVIPFFEYHENVRRMIYTTNALESLNRTLRKAIKTRASFPNDEAALKLLFMAIRHAGMRWHPAPAWAEAKAQFIITFKDRFVPSAR